MKRNFVMFITVLCLVSQLSINTVQAGYTKDAILNEHELVSEHIDGNTFNIINPNVIGYTIAENSSRETIGSLVAPLLNDTVYNNVDALVAALRELMVLRESTVSVSCYDNSIKTPSDLYNVYNYVISHLFDETSNVKQGDYLYWNFSSASFSAKVSRDTSNNIVFTISSDNIMYLSNAQQEVAVDNEISRLLSASGEIGSKNLKDSYHKIVAIYDYELDTFDYVLDSENHSTYSALIKHETVCQGYATAMYRLARTMGINSRVIASSTHGWNIVQLNGKYYYVDATWGDNDGLHDSFLLKGSVNWPTDNAHIADSRFATDIFRSTYPIALDDYVYDGSTEDSTENSASSTVENTTSTEQSTDTSNDSEEQSTEGTTEDTEESSTDSTTEEPADNTDNSSEGIKNYLRETDELVIYYEDGKAATDTTHETQGEPSTAVWNTEEPVNPYYETEANNGDSVPVVNHGGNVSTNTDINNVNAVTNDVPDSSVSITINGVDISDEMIYESEEPIISISFNNLGSDLLVVYNGTGKKTVGGTFDSNTPIEAVAIGSADKSNITYAVKTAQLGWLGEVNAGELTGTIGTDDYLIGIRFNSGNSDDNKSVTLLGLCSDLNESINNLLVSVTHRNHAWSKVRYNGVIETVDTENCMNGIRISSDTDISYRVLQGTWLPVVTNKVLAGDPFSEEKITGFYLDGAEYRVLFSDGTWSDWVTSNEVVAPDDCYVVDVQIVK